MRTFFRPKASSKPSPTSRFTLAPSLLLAAGLPLLAASASAQTLARPGWAGSGLTAEPWWRSAVFYSIDPRGFQDSDGDGTGDVKGIVERLDYLQSLGIDAIVLQEPFPTAGFDDLLAEASRHHIRIVVQLKHGTGSESPQQDAAAQLTDARAWLARGAAGIESVNGLTLDRACARPGQQPWFLAGLRHVTDTFPGERALLVGTNSGPAPLMMHARKTTDPPGPHLEHVLLNPSRDDDQGFRDALSNAQNPALGLPLLGTAAWSRVADKPVTTDPAQVAGLRKITATILLASGDAVALTYGQEIGLDRPAHANDPLIMQWTPLNITAAAPTPTAAPKPVETVYGAFTPYVPPPPNKVLGGPPQMPQVSISDNLSAAPVDANSLPGFTTARLPSAGIAANGATANVALEGGDSQSLLNFYRHLAQLHHGNATLRSGALYVLDAEVPGALAWIRRAPAGARTVASVVVVCNLSDKPIAVSLDRDLDSLGIHTGTVRPLLAADPADRRVESTDHISLAPWGVYIGELYHSTGPTGPGHR
jgi:Alpha amylase, catalytic domain